MSMLGIGPFEMLLVVIIALVVLGPEKFPEFAKMALRAIRDVRGYVQEVQDEVGKELRPIEREMRKLRQIDPEKYLDNLTGEEKKKEGLPAPKGAKTYRTGEIEKSASEYDEGAVDGGTDPEEPHASPAEPEQPSSSSEAAADANAGAASEEDKPSKPSNGSRAAYEHVEAPERLD